MSRTVFYIGPSGAGKSTAAKTLDPKSTFIFNCLGKDLPWRNSAKQYIAWNQETKEGNLVTTSSAQVIIKWLDYIDKNMPHIKDIVIDDNTFLTILELQRRKNEGWEKYDHVVENFLSLAAKSKSLRDDIVVHILHHTQIEGDGILEDKSYKAISFGKFTDEKLGGQEAQFTIVLRAAKEKDNTKINYVFYTRDANSTAKTPYEMFVDEKIPNDMLLVRQTMDCFYNGDCGEGNVVVSIKK